jgi:low molecular weight protein-tyrosine phosphatase
VYRICFLCTGNICRSPTAEGVMRSLVEAAGLADRFDLDSAGTGGWHAGEQPDPRTRAVARRRGVVLDHRARRITAGDLDRFDLILAMDGDNLRDLDHVVRGAARRPHVRLLRSFDPAAPTGAEVPDPYYGGDRGFDDVFDICDAACRGLLDHLRAELGL